jgi:ABC-type branched-subunit amino acid transport system substrate-binding protein/predicted negative regulator of RcsB-dependent stress response
MSAPYISGIYRWQRAFSIHHKLSVWSYHTGLALLCCIIGLPLAGCPPTPPAVPPSSSSQLPAAVSPDAIAAQRQAFAQAETLRTNGQFSQAQQALSDFVQRYPSGPFTDDALLALGKVATTLGDEHKAQRTYEMLLENFPTSEHAPLAQLELGMLFYQTRNYERSQTILRQFLTLASLPKHQALAHYYLGTIAREQQRYAEAIAELTLSVETHPDAELVKQARADISHIVHERLTLIVLEQLARQYLTTYPGDLILSQLAQRYRTAGSEVDEMAVLQRFTVAFPEHPTIQEAMTRLRNLQALLTTDPTRIGVLLPLSGEGSQYGQRALRGMEFALVIWQEHYADTELTLVIRDTNSDGATASDALRSLVNDVHVISVVGPLFSQVALQLASLAEQLQVPLISPYAPDGHFPILSTYAFRNSLTDELQARFLAQYATQTLNLHRFAILYPDEPYGRALKNVFIEHIIQFEGDVVAVEPYPPDATDFSPQIKRLGGIDDETLRDLRAGAETVVYKGDNDTQTPPPLYDAIFIPGYYDKVGLIAPELTFYNITGVQLLGTDGWNAREIIDIGERFVEGAIFTDGFFAASPSPLVQAFVERFQARYHEVPDLLAAQAYDTIWMIAQVLQNGAKTRTQLRDGLMQVQNFAGISGATTILPDGNVEKTPYLLTIQNGQIVQLN